MDIYRKYFTKNFSQKIIFSDSVSDECTLKCPNDIIEDDESVWKTRLFIDFGLEVRYGAKKAYMICSSIAGGWKIFPFIGIPIVSNDFFSVAHSKLITDIMIDEENKVWKIKGRLNEINNRFKEKYYDYIMENSDDNFVLPYLDYQNDMIHRKDKEFIELCLKSKKEIEKIFYIYGKSEFNIFVGFSLSLFDIEIPNFESFCFLQDRISFINLFKILSEVYWSDENQSFRIPSDTAYNFVRLSKDDFLLNTIVFNIREILISDLVSF